MGGHTAALRRCAAHACHLTPSLFPSHRSLVLSEFGRSAAIPSLRSGQAWAAPVPAGSWRYDPNQESTRPFHPEANPDSSLWRHARNRGAEGLVVSFRAEKRPRNKNYYERSRYMYENKENMDKAPEKNADISSRSATVERHFMPTVRAFTASGTPFRAIMDLPAPDCRAARRSGFARALRPCRPGAGGKAEPRGRLAATTRRNNDVACSLMHVIPRGKSSEGKKIQK